MIDPLQLALYTAAALLLAVTPGPGLFYVAARTLAGGRPEGWPPASAPALAAWSMYWPAASASPPSFSPAPRSSPG
ncbi:hypothetical protein ACFQY5_01110 [Paeniroseomonas aquatica]|uniref:hypothetical protein n=1 Tax=Paeniroseomonas aquatica TaxID=373043 RepID=UPI00360E84CF